MVATVDARDFCYEGDIYRVMNRKPEPEDDDPELEVRVDGDIQPPERDVGIMSAYCEGFSVTTLDGRALDDLLTQKALHRLEDAYIDWRCARERDAREAACEARADARSER